jgi:hypothetical protein
MKKEGGREDERLLQRSTQARIAKWNADTDEALLPTSLIEEALSSGRREDQNC